MSELILMILIYIKTEPMDKGKNGMKLDLSQDFVT